MSQLSKIDMSRHQFLLDDAAYFADKKELYYSIKNDISILLGISLSSIRVCGSAYWGTRVRDRSPFEPGVSDLDIALISSDLFVKCMSEIRRITIGFTDQTKFKIVRGENTYVRFQQYAFNKGIINPYYAPSTRTIKSINSAMNSISGRYLDHFKAISACIYDTDDSFAVKQSSALSVLLGE